MYVIPFALQDFFSLVVIFRSKCSSKLSNMIEPQIRVFSSQSFFDEMKFQAQVPKIVTIMRPTITIYFTQSDCYKWLSTNDWIQTSFRRNSIIFSADCLYLIPWILLTRAMAHFVIEANVQLGRILLSKHHHLFIHDEDRSVLCQSFRSMFKNSKRALKQLLILLQCPIWSV